MRGFDWKIPKYEMSFLKDVCTKQPLYKNKSQGNQQTSLDE